MRCYNCDGKTTVYDTTSYSGVHYRKRKCLKCGLKFNTIEDVISDDDVHLIHAFKLKNRKGK